MADPNFSIARVREIFSYDPETGIFTYKIRNGRKYPGDTVSIPEKKYAQVKIDKGRAYVHRLAFFYVHERWPVGDIDHINGIKTDNRIANIRDVSHSVNLENLRKPLANNKAGFLGVTKSHNRWRATIRANGKQVHIGMFDTPEEAYLAYLSEKRKHHIGCQI